MKKGKNQHEKILNTTLEKLQKKGYKIIPLKNKSPTAIAINHPFSEGIFIHKGKKYTVSYLKRTYNMFDKITRYDYSGYAKEIYFLKVKREYESRGYRFIYLENKSPDGIVFDKHNNIYAVEVIGKHEGSKSNHKISLKKDLYYMFDGIMFKTFYYNSNEVFTETYGKHRPPVDFNFHSQKGGLGDE